MTLLQHALLSMGQYHLHMNCIVGWLSICLLRVLCRPWYSGLEPLLRSFLALAHVIRLVGLATACKIPPLLSTGQEEIPLRLHV